MVVKGEYGLTAAMEKHGYTIDTLMSKYRRVGGGGGGVHLGLVRADHQSASLLCCTRSPRPLPAHLNFRCLRLTDTFFVPTCRNWGGVCPGLGMHVVGRPLSRTPSIITLYPTALAGGLGRQVQLELQQQCAPEPARDVRRHFHAPLRDRLCQGFVARGPPFHRQIRRVGDRTGGCL